MDNNPVALNDVDGLCTGGDRKPKHKKRTGIRRGNLRRGAWKDPKDADSGKETGRLRRFFGKLGQGIANLVSNTWDKIKDIGQNLNIENSNIDWNKTFSYLLKPWGHLDIRIFGHRLVSRQHREITRLWNPFAHSKLPHFKKENQLEGLFGISIGLRVNNYILFNIRLGRTAMFENYFPEYINELAVNKLFFIKFAYSVDPNDPTYRPASFMNSAHFLLMGKMLRLRCLDNIFPPWNFWRNQPWQWPRPIGRFIVIDIIYRIFNAINNEIGERNRRYNLF
jgi:hypothetical protein